MNEFIVGINTQLYDLNGDVILDNVSPLGSSVDFLTRRVNRYSTLNQSAILDDQGFSDGDRTITIGIDDITDDQLSIIKNIIRYHANIYLVLWDGCYNAALQTFNPDAGRVTLTILIQSRADGL